MIDERPAHIETRGEAGHWENDNVMGASSGNLHRDLDRTRHGLCADRQTTPPHSQATSQKIIALIR